MLADVIFELLSNIDDDALKLLDLSHRFPLIHPCIGVHPWYVDEESIDQMIDLIRERKEEIVGIGEIGLDGAKHLLDKYPVKI